MTPEVSVYTCCEVGLGCPLQGLLGASRVHAKDASLDKRGCNFCRGLRRVEQEKVHGCLNFPVQARPWEGAAVALPALGAASLAARGPAKGWF